jgi:hypothetical protein
MRATSRLLLLALVICGLSACGSGSDSESEWQTRSSTPGRFTADFPVKPERQTQRVPAAGEPLELVVFTADSADEAVSVSYVDYRTPAAGEDAKKVLDSAVEGVASSLQGRNLKKTETTFQNFEALDFSLEVDPQVLDGRAVWADSRMYLLQVVRNKTGDSESFDRLVESFKLARAPVGPPADPPSPSPSTPATADLSPQPPILTP